jgi:putative ABC transport system permease protein
MATLWQDIRFGLRMLLKSPGFTALAVLALALGIGANTAIFSVAIAILQKPVSFPELDRLVAVVNVAPQDVQEADPVSPADYFDWKRQTQSLGSMATIHGTELNLTGNGDPEKVHGEMIASNLFDVLGTGPVIGRAFLPEEEQPGGDREVILGYGLWQRRFASDPNIVGRTISLNGEPYTIVGVTGSEFNFPSHAELYVPLAFDDATKAVRADHFLHPVARLKPGVSLRDAQAEMFTIQGRLQQQFPDTEKAWSVRVLPLKTWVSGELADEYGKMLIGAAILVLLIACANVANLLFARSASRIRQMAVRQALGASRVRIIRQLLTESLLLATVGASLGLLLGLWGIDAIRHYMPPEVEQFLPYWRHVRLETDVFWYTVAVAFLAGIVSGLAPAFQSSRFDVYEDLKDGGRSSSAGQSRQRLRSIFVVAEISLSLILLVGAGLMTKGVRALLNVNPNLNPEDALTMRVSLPDSKYKTPLQLAVFYDRALDGLKSLPGVQSSMVASSLPSSGETDGEFISVQGRQKQPGEDDTVNINAVSSNFFHGMNIPLRQGRFLSDTDGPDQPFVAVISQKFATRFFPSQNPLGKLIKVGEADSKTSWAQVVGVVGDVHYEPYDRQEIPAVYFPYQQSPADLVFLIMRTAGDPASYAAAARSQITRIDPDQPVFDITPFEKVIDNHLLGLSYVATMMTLMGVIALLLASIGVYGVMAYAVTERTHEIGVRLALGAQPRDVLQLVLRRGLILTFVGLLIGLPIAFGVAQILSNIIYGVSAADLATFGGIGALMCVITFLACYIPARRAMQVDPMIALRYE